MVKLGTQDFDGFDVDSTKYEISCTEGGYFVLIRPKLLSTPSTKIKFAWFKGETQVYTNTSHYITGRGDLVVVDVSQSSFGKYRVVASCDELGKVVSKEYTVSRMENGYNILTFGYSLSYSEEGMRIRWFFDGIPILGSESGFVLTQNNRRLIMNNPTTFNEGRHKLDCKVDAALGRLFDMKSTLIIFKDTPKLRTIPNDVFKPIGSSLEIKCSVDKNHGTYNIILWYFNGKEIPSEHGKLSITSISRKNYGIYQCEVINDQTSSKYDISSKGLTIHELETSDSGLYTCEAKNSNGIAFASAKIIVPVKLVFLRKYFNTFCICIIFNILYHYNLIENPPRNQSVLIGTNIEIPCEVRKEFKTNSQVMWFMNGEPESASAFLKIIERPQMPTLVHAELINETTPSMIRISWLQGFDGNSPIIRHSIEMRTLGSSQLWSDWETVVETVPSEDCCAYLIDNVRPSVTAQFRVLASNRFGMGKPSLPSVFLLNIFYFIIKHSYRYRLAGYTLPWIEKNVTTKDARNAVIDQLITWRDYEIQIAAYNERGLGVFSKSIDVTTAEGGSNIDFFC
uniref:Ig-like domain-containing protein n=1 Tax=Heterorhabditis bacteriophora TaxID=37862 RepID=A0A1I7W996_HETBA